MFKNQAIRPTTDFSTKELGTILRKEKSRTGVMRRLLGILCPVGFVVVGFLDIFPVPAKDYVFINYQLDEKLKDAEMIIYNHLGQNVYQHTLQSEYGFLTISKDNLKGSGIYICIISNNSKNVLTQKFIMTE